MLFECKCSMITSIYKVGQLRAQIHDYHRQKPPPAVLPGQLAEPFGTNRPKHWAITVRSTEVRWAWHQWITSVGSVLIRLQISLWEETSSTVKKTLILKMLSKYCHTKWTTLIFVFSFLSCCHLHNTSVVTWNVETWSKVLVGSALNRFQSWWRISSRTRVSYKGTFTRLI